MSTVVFVMEWVPQYRAPFYDALRAELARSGVDVRLIHGDPPPSRRKRRDEQRLPWAEVVGNRFLTIGGLEVTLQPVWRAWQPADLVVIQHEAGLALNYAVLSRARLGGPPVALWGHGENPNQVGANGTAEWLKRRMTPRADWIFAYTARSATVYESCGGDPARTTIVQNAIDVSALTSTDGVVSESVARLVDDVGRRTNHVGWMVSALDQWKRVPFLVNVLDAVRARVDDFEFFVLGAGASAPILERAAQTRSWLHVMGPVFGADKAAIGRIARITVHPGLVGLHVIEAFATASPMVTADVAYHSHEVDYLEHGVNAIVLPRFATVRQFADAVAGLFEDETELRSLQAGCRSAASRYTLDAMVTNFAAGVNEALAAQA